MKKTAFTVLTILLIIILAELLLSIAVMVLRKDADKIVRDDDANTIRILALGESTTDDYWGDNELGAWPRQLERKLKKKGFSVKVFNVARGGTTTTFILSNLQKHLKEFEPQIVISMMGINDNNKMVYEGELTEKSNPFSWILSFKTVKILRWVFFEKDLRSALDLSPLVDDQQDDTFKVASYLEENKLVSLEQIPIKFKAKTACHKSVYLRQAAVINLERFKHQKNTPYQIEMTRKAFRLCPHNQWNSFWYFNRHTHTEKYRAVCLEDFYLIEPYLNFLPEEIINNIVHCFLNKPLPASLLNILSSKGIKISQERAKVTRRHYQILNKILTDKGITHVAMQYPTLSINQIKDYLGPKADVIYIENRENFQPFLGERYNEVFKDRFRGTWGHTNQRGHGMIADKLTSTIERIILSKTR